MVDNVEVKALLYVLKRAWEQCVEKIEVGTNLRNVADWIKNDIALLTFILMTLWNVRIWSICHGDAQL